MSKFEGKEPSLPTSMILCHFSVLDAGIVELSLATYVFSLISTSLSISVGSRKRMYVFGRMAECSIAMIEVAQVTKNGKVMAKHRCR